MPGCGGRAIKDKLQKYFLQRVEVNAHGISYRGLLAGADEDYLYLKAPTTWITLPLENVSSVKLEGEKDWDHKEVPGEPKPAALERAEKKRYSASDLAKVHACEGAEEWPEPDDKQD